MLVVADASPLHYRIHPDIIRELLERDAARQRDQR